MNINTDKWDAMDRVIKQIIPKSMPQTETLPETDTSTNPFEKFQSRDERVKAFTDKDGVVTRYISGQHPIIVYETMKRVGDNFVYIFTCRKNRILTRLPSIPNGIALNKAFFDNFSDNDMFMVHIIPNKGKNVLETYTIKKSKALKEGKLKQYPGYEKQIAISLNYWDKLELQGTE